MDLLGMVALTEEQIAWCGADKGFVRPDNPPAWVNDEGTWERAKKAVEPYWGNYSEPWAVVTHVYQQMGGS